jgi:hypothetical protein
MPKVLSYRQLMDKKYAWLPELPQNFTDSFGGLTKNFDMMIWGPSGHGKSNLTVKILKFVLLHGRGLYVSGEEGTGPSMQMMIMRHLGEDYTGKIQFADHTMTLHELRKRLAKKNSEQFIVIDSIQYFTMDYTEYKKLKQDFPNKAFVFISHPKGREPEGKTAFKIKHDVDIKIRVQNYIGVVKSRLKFDGITKNIVIHEEGAKKAWGKKYKEALEMDL